jgi:hypothetical protein
MNDQAASTASVDIIGYRGGAEGRILFPDFPLNVAFISVKHEICGDRSQGLT